MWVVSMKETVLRKLKECWSLLSEAQLEGVDVASSMGLVYKTICDIKGEECPITEAEWSDVAEGEYVQCDKFEGPTDKDDCYTCVYFGGIINNKDVVCLHPGWA